MADDDGSSANSSNSTKELREARRKQKEQQMELLMARVASQEEMIRQLMEELGKARLGSPQPLTTPSPGAQDEAKETASASSRQDREVLEEDEGEEDEDDEDDAPVAAPAAERRAASAREKSPAERSRLPPPRAPIQLTWAKATSEARVVEDWLRDMERIFRQGRVSRGAQMDEARCHMDSQLERWWESRAELLDEEERAEWSALANALREEFVPKQLQREARQQLLNLRHNAGESVHDFCQRALLLQGQARMEQATDTVMLLLVQKLNKDEWPFTSAQVMRAYENGEFRSVGQLRAEMVALAANEPNLGRRAATGGQQGGTGRPATKPKSHQSGGQTAPRQLAPAEVDPTGKEGETPTMEGLARQVAALQARMATGGGGQKASHCLRCRSTEHWVKDCPAPDPRTCNKCGEKGHIARGCTKN